MKRPKSQKAYQIYTLVMTALFLALPLFAEQVTDEVKKPSLDSLISSADIVALVQLDDTRYKTIRGFPSQGEAWLSSLIIYKGSKDIDTIVVYDEGVKGDHCYFPDTDLWQEGNRFLVFLKHTDTYLFEGLTPVCYLAVSVSSKNQYILRMPADNVILPTELLDEVGDYKFLDAGSRIDATELNRPERAAQIALNTMTDEGDSLVYTRGIHISAVRKYIRSKLSNLTAQ